MTINTGAVLVNRTVLGFCGRLSAPTPSVSTPSSISYSVYHDRFELCPPCAENPRHPGLEQGAEPGPERTLALTK